MLRPTGHRILIQPDEQPEQTGAILLPQHREFVATSGTVIALGPRGSRVRWEARQRALREAVSGIESLKSTWATASDNIAAIVAPALRNAESILLRLIGSPDPEHEIAVGDRVAFDSESGLKLFRDGIEYLILDEDDVVVIVEETEAVA